MNMDAINHITELTLEEISGKISKERAQELHNLVAENQEVFDLWQSIHREFESKEYQNAITSFPDRLRPNDIFSKSNQKKKKKLKTVRYATVGAAAATIIVFSLILFKRPAHQDASFETSERGVQLSFQNGQTINISAKSGNTLVDDVTVKYDSGRVSVNAASSASSQWGTIQVPNGMDYRLALADGSEVWINAGTSVKFPFYFSDTAREIIVNGEAFVKVIRNDKAPFTVHLSNGDVEVLGTEFNVKNIDATSEVVSLVNGKVLYKSNNQQQLLLPGQQLISQKNAPLRVETFDENDVLAWTKGIFLIKNGTIKEIAEGLKRHMGIDVSIDPGMDHRKTFTGSIDRNKPVTAFLRVLKLTDNINSFYFDQDSTLHLK